MKFASILLITGLLSGPFALQGDVPAHAVEAPAPMQYYLADIEPSFAGVVALLELHQICEAKFPGECGDLTANGVAALQDSAGLLGAISLLAVPRHRYRAEQFSSSYEVARALDSEELSLVSELKKFDMKFMGRYGATADVCPYARQEAHVGTLAKVVLHRYWNLQGGELNAAIAEIGSIRREYAAKLRADFSPDACVEIGKQGSLLTEVFKLRLKLYNLDKARWQPLALRDQFAGGAAFLWDFVTKMEADIGNQPFVKYLKKHSVDQ